MLNKKILFGFMAFALLPMISPNIAIAENDSDQVYFRLGYKPTYVGNQMIYNKKVISSTGVISNDDYKTNYDFNFYGASIGIGKYFNPETRAEIEIAGNLAFDLDKDSSKIFGNVGNPDEVYMNKGFSYTLASLNVYYTVNSNVYDISPYVGAGIGLARVNFMSDKTSDSITYPMALQFKAGIQTKINNMLPFYVGYTLSYFPEKETDNIKTNTNGSNKTTKVTASYILHSAEIGFIFMQ